MTAADLGTLGEIAAWQLDRVQDLVESVFGEAVETVALFGSAVRGGLRPDSDLDVLVVVSRAVVGSERRALIDGLMALSRRRERQDLRHLEVTVVARPDVRPWRYPPPLAFQYGDWWRAEFAAGDDHPWISPNPDLAVILTAARADAVSLSGRPLDEVLEPVPFEDLHRALRDVVPELLPGITEGDDVRNSLLTLARAWLTLETDRIEPKDVAADWALDRMPDGTGDALRRARDGYRGTVVDTWDAGAIALAERDAAAMVERIEAREVVEP